MKVRDMIDLQDYIYSLKVLAVAGSLFLAGAFTVMFTVESLMWLVCGILLGLFGALALAIALSLLWFEATNAENNLYRISRYRE